MTTQSCATRQGRRIALLLATAFVVTAPVVGAASPALAHNYVVSSTPASGANLTELPEEFEVTTNAPLLTLDGATNGFAIQVTDAAGRFYGDGCVTVSGPSITMRAALGEAGAYTLTWQAISGDGHTVSGTIPFTWTPASATEVSAGSAAAPRCRGSEPETGSSGGNGSGTTGSAPTAPETTNAADPSRTVPLGTVLWIGGAVVAVGLAVGITILIAGRRAKPTV
ncbi:MAG TPA: copper resistance CopC family protein [Pseudolysinimonas sp.]|nr:copper resistance CopC family protein [Pseudolysinimonas sp.]